MLKRILTVCGLLIAIAALAACGGSKSLATPTSAPAESTATPAISIAPQATTVAPAPTSAADVTTPVPTPDIEKVINAQPDDWSRGAISPTVTFIEWSDFQCPYCASLEPVLEKLMKAYPNDVQVVYRHFPLISIHDKAEIAAEATEAAGAQKKFWEMHDILFANHNQWAESSPADFRKALDTFATQIGLDVKQFDSDLDSGKYKQKVTDSYNLAAQLGLNGTPFILVNQNPWPQDLNYLSYNNLVGIVKLFAELPKKQFKQAPAMTIDAKKSYTATLKTDQGDIVLKLYADKAPIAVNNFVFLSQQKWYDGLTFHRVITDFMAQSGDPTGLGYGGPGYTFVNEIADLKFDRAGLLAMANGGRDNTNGSQFFITMAPQPDLDGKYTIFGEVVSGMDVVNKLVIRDPQSSPDTQASMINSIVIEEK